MCGATKVVPAVSLESKFAGTLVKDFLCQFLLRHVCHEVGSSGEGIGVEALLQQWLEVVDGIGSVAQTCGTLGSREVCFGTAEGTGEFVVPTLRQVVSGGGDALEELRAALVACAVEVDEVGVGQVDDGEEVAAELLQCHDALH